MKDKIEPIDMTAESPAVAWSMVILQLSMARVARGLPTEPLPISPRRLGLRPN